MRRSPAILVSAAVIVPLAACSSTPGGRAPGAVSSAPTASSTGSTFPSDEMAETEIDIPVVSFEGPVRDSPVPYFGTQTPSGGIAQAAPDFVVAEALATINTRPQPIDDYEEVVVGQQYFVVVAPAFPSELADDLAVVLEWVDAIVTDGQFNESNVSPDNLGIAISNINEFVDTNCLGR